jgi:predicted MFS family arabinose efflux permease
MLLLMRTPDSDRVRGPVRLRDFVSTCRRHWPGPILLVNISFGVCMTAPFVFVASFIDQVPVEIPGISVIGLFFWCYAGLAIGIRLLLRRLPDRIGSGRVLAVGALAMALGMTSYCLVDSLHPWRIVVPALMCGAGHGLMFHTMTSLTLHSFPIEVRGTGSALGLMMLDLGLLGGAPVLGLIGEHFGYSAMFVSMGVCCALSLVPCAITHLKPAVSEPSVAAASKNL